MKKCYFDAEKGYFLSSVESKDDQVMNANETPNAICVEGEFGIGHYWDGAKVVEIPPKPSELHGFDYATKAWVINKTAVNARRVKFLEQSDWTDTLSAKNRLGQTLYDQWQTYRQALRDITDQPDLENIVWPTAPTA